MKDLKTERRKRFAGEDQRSPNAWMLTYTDLCTLLMTFFLLLISMSVVDEQRLKKALNSLDGAIGFSSTGRSILGIGEENRGREYGYSADENRPVDYETLKDVSLKKDLAEEMQIFKKNGKTYIQIQQQALFEPASYRISPKFEPFLTLLSKHLGDSREEVEIRGHTDPYEGINRPYWTKASWGLSLRRALGVYDFLRAHGVPADRLSVHGFSYYRTAVDSLEHPDLRSRNERVEIVLGPNESLPSSLLDRKTHVRPYVNYKNFFFKLFPMPDGK
jgi:chemotaxis protein MotB